MKKVLTAVFATALVLAASCDSKENGNKTAGNYSAEEVALGDSLSTSFGQMQAAQAQSTFNRYKAMMTPDQLKNFNKDEYLKGLELVLTTDTANIAFLNGVQQGLQMYGIFMDKNLGVPVDAKKLVAAFAEVYKTDSLTQEQILATYRQKLKPKPKPRPARPPKPKRISLPARNISANAWLKVSRKPSRAWHTKSSTPERATR